MTPIMTPTIPVKPESPCMNPKSILWPEMPADHRLVLAAQQKTRRQKQLEEGPVVILNRDWKVNQK